MDVIPSGNLRNIEEYADFVFNNDADQKKAFTLIVAAFIVELYNIPGTTIKRIHANHILKPLKEINHTGQFVAFLSGPGGTGKSKVINTVLTYCKNLCSKVGVRFNKRTIIVTALTGAAAINIFGETVHSAYGLNKTSSSTDDIDEWKDTLMVIIDEISFASEQTLRKINNKINILKEVGNEGRFGDIPIVFAGDFTQLAPVR